MNKLILQLTDIIEQHYHESYGDNYYQHINIFLEKDLTNSLLQYQLKHLGKLTQKLNNYALNFINNPNKQYFYIKSNDTFIEYDCKQYQIINEDAIWYKILHNISSTHPVTSEQKQALKNKIIFSIKNQSILNTIPDSFTIQTILKYM